MSEFQFIGRVHLLDRIAGLFRRLADAPAILHRIGSNMIDAEILSRRQMQDIGLLDGRSDRRGSGQRERCDRHASSFDAVRDIGFRRNL